MQVVIDESVYKRNDKRKRIKESPVVEVSYDPNLFELLKLPPDVLAKQVTLCDLKRFRTITHDELFSKGWDKKEAEKRKLVPNIFKFTSHFNQLSFWSALEVLKESSAKGRAEKITYFLKMSKCLGELNNYHSLLAIIMGLNINAIFRLNHTWELVHKRERNYFREQVALSDQNWLKLKGKMNEAKIPFIPHVGVFLQEISGISSHPKLSQAEKHSQIQSSVNLLNYFQQSTYDIQYMNHVQEFLTSEKYIIELQRFMEEDLMKLSFEVEPLNNDSTVTPPSKSSKMISKSLEDITAIEEMSPHPALHPNHALRKGSPKPGPLKTFTRGHRKTHSLSVLEGFNTDKEKAGTELLLGSPILSLSKTPSVQSKQNLIDDSVDFYETRRRSASEPPNCSFVEPLHSSLEKINEVAIEGTLLKKTCLRRGSQPKIRRWKPYHAVVSGGKLCLYILKGHKSQGGLGQSSQLRKSLELKHCAVTLSSEDKHEHTFSVSDTIGNVYKFQAAEKGNSEVWVELLHAQKRSLFDKGDLIKL